tara:strand:- start:98 stop:307 length:210 start_codon:yes stop_codon:yes gene_type:complete
MPIKLKQSTQTKDRVTGKIKTEHFYIKTMSQENLFKEFNSSTIKPKIKQKVRNEIDRRGIKIEWVPKET